MAHPAETPAQTRRYNIQMIAAAVVGTAYGLAARYLFGMPHNANGDHGTTFSIMSLAFIFVVPVALGASTVMLMPHARRTWPAVMFHPWIACGMTLVSSAIAALEGSVCIIFMAPVMLVCASLGGVVAHLVQRRGHSTMAFAAFAALPFVAAPLESLIETPIERRTVLNEIVVDAPVPIVWNLVKSVDEIKKDEQRFGWSYVIGFPRPHSATLSHEGVGAVRHATFERQVVFKETVDQWEEGRLLSFSIKPEAIPAESLDEHVTIGGKYFDVLQGTYELVPQGDKTLVKLSSTHRLSTNFNRYAALWSDFIMGDIQSNILQVIKKRAEG